MTVIRKDLGTVTAYAYAVSKGYTGTEAEFAELMASYADVAEEAAQSASDAENAAERAEAAAATLTVDDALSDTSTNPVQNKVITGEVAQVKSQITDITGNTAIPVIGYHEYIDLSGSSVTMLNGVPQKSGSSGSYSYGMIACSAGDKFTINGTGGGQTRAYGFVSSDGSILTVSPSSKTYTGLVVTAPEDSAWLIVHTNDDRASYVGTELKILVQENADKIVDIDSTEKKQYVLNWVLGSIDNTGTETSSSNRIRSNSVPFSLVDIIELDSGVKYALKFYDTKGVFVGGTGWISTSGTMAECLRNIYTVTGREAYVRFQMAYSGDDNISDVSALGEKLTFTRVSYPKDLQDQILEVEQKLTGPYIPALDWVLGHIGTSGSDTNAKNRIREREMLLYSIPAKITAENDIKYVIRAYNSSGVFIAGTGWKTGNGNVIKKYSEDAIPTGNEYYYRIAVAYSTDANVTDIATLASKITIEQTMAISDLESVVHNNAKNILTLQKKHRPPINSTGLGNCSIRCAKEQSYVDGSAPQIEFFLLEEPVTHNFYYSRDLSTKEYMFTFTGDAHKYSFGVLQNGDVIACLDADAISVNTKDDANRQNPYVFLASENWSIQHEVNFGSSLKPCGWLENCGFKVLANGDAIFCEYTRQTTATANAWKISGDPTNKANWTATQSFAITTTDNSNGFKHCHMVMQDFYTGICYLATGDSDTGAMLFCSDDNGSTWTQLLSPDSASHDHETGFSGGSEKYCRMLSMTFTENYIYWATDTAVTVNHYLFRCERDNDGVLDYSTITEIVNIPRAHNAATYGTAYIPEMNAILLLERTDAAEQEMPVRMVTLADEQLHTIGKMEVCPDLASTGANLGFRTRFSEWYPYNGLVRVGYDLMMQTHNNATNQNKGFGNEGHTSTGKGADNINNLFLQVYKDGTDYGFHLGTYYL